MANGGECALERFSVQLRNRFEVLANEQHDDEIEEL